jgi:hypothetical protein
LETFFLMEDKRAMCTQKFHRKNTFHNLLRGWAAKRAGETVTWREPVPLGP